MTSPAARNVNIALLGVAVIALILTMRSDMSVIQTNSLINRARHKANRVSAAKVAEISEALNERIADGINDPVLTLKAALLNVAGLDKEAIRESLREQIGFLPFREHGCQKLLAWTKSGEASQEIEATKVSRLMKYPASNGSSTLWQLGRLADGQENRQQAIAVMLDAQEFWPNIPPQLFYDLAALFQAEGRDHLAIHYLKHFAAAANVTMQHPALASLAKNISKESAQDRWKKISDGPL
jgi:hypothetical protein